MSTIIMISLAIAIIFWRPPFQFPRLSRKTITPIIMIIIVASLLLLGTFESSSDKGCCPKTASQAHSPESLLDQSAF
ncbi:MAG: hypothetical protein JSW07_08815 [bacterium]|nr:MAG: hypothetical protein JSW07_08815 [bacterium]